MALTAVFLELSVLLTIAVVSHFFMKRFRQPTIVGEIAIGVVLGPTLIGFMTPVPGPGRTVAVFVGPALVPTSTAIALAQGRKRSGVLLGAAAPASLKVNRDTILALAVL